MRKGRSVAGVPFSRRSTWIGGCAVTKNHGITWKLCSSTLPVLCLSMRDGGHTALHRIARSIVVAEECRRRTLRQGKVLKEGNMKKDTGTRATDWEMRKEYDFTNLHPNKYARKYAEGTNIVVIEPDLAKIFPDSESVNTALRALVSAFPKAKPKGHRVKRSLVRR